MRSYAGPTQTLLVENILLRSGCRQEGQAVLEAVVELLETDRSKDVRTAALESLPLHVSTLPVLLECMQDDNSLVRRAVIQRLHSISITLLRYV